jgi:hypothetical protein
LSEAGKEQAMIVTKQGQDRNKPAATIGFWAALLTAVLNLWFFIAFVPNQPILVAPWQGLAAYTASFQPLPFLAWIVPCFFLAPMILTMMTCLHAWAQKEKQTWSLLALVFAVVYATLLSANYYIQMTVVRHHLVNGTTEGLSLWLFGYHSPYNIPQALEAVGYGFLCVSSLFAAQVFEGGKLQQWVRWSFVGTGLSGLVYPISLLFPLPGVLALVDLVALGVLLILAPVLLALLFQRSKYRTVAVA